MAHWRQLAKPMWRSPEWGSCQRKKRLPKKVAEKKAVEYGIHYYACKYCGEWHLTKMKQKARRDEVK